LRTGARENDYYSLLHRREKESITEEGGVDCATGFVYCPGRSTCFTDIVDTDPNDKLWGWSIEYNASESTIDDCDIYVGGFVAEGHDLVKTSGIGALQSQELIQGLLGKLRSSGQASLRTSSNGWANSLPTESVSSLGVPKQRASYPRTKN
jgi:hypothetical protein